MNCLKCNGELEPNARFCRFCGNKIDFPTATESSQSSDSKPAFNTVQDANAVTEESKASENKSTVEVNEVYQQPVDNAVDVEETAPSSESDRPIEKEYFFPDNDGGDDVENDADSSENKSKSSVKLGIIIAVIIAIIAAIAVVLTSQSKTSDNYYEYDRYYGVPSDAETEVDSTYDDYTESSYGETVSTEEYDNRYDDYVYDEPAYEEPTYDEPSYYEEETNAEVEESPIYNSEPERESWYSEEVEAATEEIVEEAFDYTFPHNNGTSDSSKKLIIAYGGLRLREAPDINATQVGLILDGSIVTIEQINGDWAYTSFEGVYGWCHRDYLFEPSNYSMPAIYSAMVTEYIGTELVTDKYFDNKNVTTIIPNGFTVYVYEIKGNKAFVSYNNVYGWCSTEFLVMS